MINKDTVKKNFNKYAELYDKFCNIQNQVGDHLIGKISHLLDRGGNPGCILEIGCGTGNYTMKVDERFKYSEILSVDICEKMIEVAKKKKYNNKVSFLVADGEEIDFASKFDVITSNATFQWFNNIKCSMERYAGMLRENGIIAFSTFGPLTFRELNLTLGKQTKDTNLIAGEFLDKDELKNILSDIFSKIEIEEEIIRERFSKLHELLRKIKFTGETGNGLGNKIFFSRRMLFEEITISYQIFYINGVRS